MRQHDRIEFALDSANRYKDADGRLHVRVSHISKANVCPYFGREIPGARELGLDDAKIYWLWRHPDELTKGAPTANNIQLLEIHIGVSADDPQKERIIGSTGTDAEYLEPYLNNSLVVWDQEAIDDIESGRKKQLSCGYRYRPDMVSGEHEGFRYDGIMRDIVFNHVALVEAGRAGPDVMVGDSLEQVGIMALKSRTALMTRGALAVALAPLMATDAAPVDLNALLADVRGPTFATQKPAILSRVEAATRGKLKSGASLDTVRHALDAMENEACDSEEEDDAAEDAEEETEEERKAREAKDKRAKDRRRARDAEAEEEERKARDAEREEDRKATDRAIQTAMDSQRAEFAAIRRAENDVRPVIGDLKEQPESAAAVYKLALDHLKIDVKGYSEAVWPELFRAHVEARAAAPKPTRKPQRADDSQIDPASAALAGSFARIRTR